MSASIPVNAWSPPPARAAQTPNVEVREGDMPLPFDGSFDLWC